VAYYLYYYNLIAPFFPSSNDVLTPRTCRADA